MGSKLYRHVFVMENYDNQHTRTNNQIPLFHRGDHNARQEIQNTAIIQQTGGNQSASYSEQPQAPNKI